jgi:hypothetical protein
VCGGVDVAEEDADTALFPPREVALLCTELPRPGGVCEAEPCTAFADVDPEAAADWLDETPLGECDVLSAPPAAPIE